jgi:hypothetical protein
MSMNRDWLVRAVLRADRHTMECVIRCLVTHDRSHHACCVARIRKLLDDSDRKALQEVT